MPPACSYLSQGMADETKVTTIILFISPPGPLNSTNITSRFISLYLKLFTSISLLRTLTVFSLNSFSQDSGLCVPLNLNIAWRLFGLLMLRVVGLLLDSCCSSADTRSSCTCPAMSSKITLGAFISFHDVCQSQFRLITSKGHVARWAVEDNGNKS